MNEHETIADIIAEMRQGMNPNGTAECQYLESDICMLADRLDAAHKRELSKNTSKNGADFGQLGDAAKLREALKHIKDRLPHMLQYMRVHWEDASAGGYFDELMLVINAALSTPPRNCDKYPTFNDAIRALADKRGWHDAKWDSERYCILAQWLFATATEKEGGNNGK